jgi:hypothetical protein
MIEHRSVRADESPRVGAWPQFELQHPVHVRDPNPRCGERLVHERVWITAAGSDDELSDPDPFVDLAVRAEGREALVLVRVSVQDDVDPLGVEQRPKRSELRDRVVPLDRSGRVSRVVPVGDLAAV